MCLAVSFRAGLASSLIQKAVCDLFPVFSAVAAPATTVVHVALSCENSRATMLTLRVYST